MGHFDGVHYFDGVVKWISIPHKSNKNHGVVCNKFFTILQQKINLIHDFR